MKLKFTAATEVTISSGSTTTIPSKVITIPPKKKIVNQITILSMTDKPIAKKVIVRTLEIGIITLWEGLAYDAIGQWTDDDVKQRILEIITNN
jgi:hypothetical protein